MALPQDIPAGRETGEFVSGTHFVTGNSMRAPFPAHLGRSIFALGCYWGGERTFWDLPGVHSTAAGYAGGSTPNPTYEEVAGGSTGHFEAVQIIYDPARIDFGDLLRVFWEAHDPTQGNRQGIETGRQYHSAIFVNDEHEGEVAASSMADYQAALAQAGKAEAITTEIRRMQAFYYAADTEQQYLAKHPQGPNTLDPTGVPCSRCAVPVRAPAGASAGLEAISSR